MAISVTDTRRLDAYRSLFDPWWVPPALVGLDKEQSIIHGFIADNMATKQVHGTSDGLGTSIMIHGMGGIGKATLARKVMHAIPLVDPEHDPRHASISIDCREKEQEQVLTELACKLKILDAGHVAGTTIARTWNIISGWLRNHAGKHVVNVCLSNIECMPLPFVSRLTSNMKQLGVNLLLTTRMRHNMHFIDDVDIDIPLEEYTTRDLLSIVDTRASIAFQGIEITGLSRLVTDAIVEHDSARPLPCINVLKALYPRMTYKGAGSEVSLAMAQDCIRHALPALGYGEFDMADFFSSAPVQAVVFIDNVVSWFDARGEYYVNSTGLEEMFSMACEHLEITAVEGEFEGIIAEVLAHNILVKSNHGPGEFFMMIPTSTMKAFVDEVLR